MSCTSFWGLIIFLVLFFLSFSLFKFFVGNGIWLSLILTIGVFTFILLVPSSTSSLLILQSKADSNSIIALSVSISAIKSPALIISPSLTNHFAIPPSSMVGDNAGISISLLFIFIKPFNTNYPSKYLYINQLNQVLNFLMQSQQLLKQFLLSLCQFF